MPDHIIFVCSSWDNELEKTAGDVWSERRRKKQQEEEKLGKIAL